MVRVNKSREQILPAFYRGISQACAIVVVEEEKSLSEFSGAIFENDIEKFKQACSEFEKLTINELVANYQQTFRFT